MARKTNAGIIRYGSSCSSCPLWCLPSRKEVEKMVESVCIIPSHVHIVGLGLNDRGEYLVAFEVGEEDTEFMYLDDFYEMVSSANHVDALMRIINEVFGEKDD